MKTLEWIFFGLAIFCTLGFITQSIVYYVRVRCSVFGPTTKEIRKMIISIITFSGLIFIFIGFFLVFRFNWGFTMPTFILIVFDVAGGFLTLYLFKKARQLNRQLKNPSAEESSENSQLYEEAKGVKLCLFVLLGTMALLITLVLLGVLIYY